MGYNGEYHLEEHAMPDTGTRLEFTGSGSEYFRIWIVNLLLTIITFGIYSAWAKVRRTQYFYQHTLFDGSGFEYHGNPVSILKGRAIAFVALLAYNLSFQYSPTLGFVFMAALLALIPWFIWKSLQFKLYNSSYRGIRFGFRGSRWQAYQMYLLLPLLSGITLGLATPFMHQRIKRFQHQESRFGDTHFSFDASVGSFYKMYLIGSLVAIGGLLVILMFSLSSTLLGGQGGGPGKWSMIVSGFLGYAWLFTIGPLFFTMMQNLVWNHTRLGTHQFAAHLQWGGVTFIAFTNLLGIICTLGLFMPFAKVRMTKYLIESIELKVDGGLDNFVTSTRQHVSSTSEGMADFLDFDMSF